MSGEGAIHGLPEDAETRNTPEQPAADHLSTGARDLAYKPGDCNTSPSDVPIDVPAGTPEVAGVPEMAGDFAKLASMMATWARTSKLFDGAANALALNNCRDNLDPQFVAVLEWNQENPEEVRKLLSSMQGAVG